LTIDYMNELRKIFVIFKTYQRVTLSLALLPVVPLRLLHTLLDPVIPTITTSAVAQSEFTLSWYHDEGTRDTAPSLIPWFVEERPSPESKSWVQDRTVFYLPNTCQHNPLHVCNDISAKTDDV